MKMNVALTADEMMDVLDAAMDEAIDRGFDDDDEDFVEDMLAIVDAALSAMGINITEEVEEEEEEEEEEEFYTLTAKGNFVVKYMELGYSFHEAMEVADALFDNNEEEEEEEKPDVLEQYVYEEAGERVLPQSIADFILEIMFQRAYEKHSEEEALSLSTEAFKKMCADYHITGIRMGE